MNLRIPLNYFTWQSDNVCWKCRFSYNNAARWHIASQQRSVVEWGLCPISQWAWIGEAEGGSMRSRGGGAEASGVMTMKKQYITSQQLVSLYRRGWRRGQEEQRRSGGETEWCRWRSSTPQFEVILHFGHWSWVLGTCRNSWEVWGPFVKTEIGQPLKWAY